MDVKQVISKQQKVYVNHAMMLIQVVLIVIMKMNILQIIKDLKGNEDLFVINAEKDT
jgi:hypothetical protein